MLPGITTALKKARKTLAGRHLFDNWPSLMIKYALLKLGFDVKLIAKIRGCILGYVHVDAVFYNPIDYAEFIERREKHKLGRVTIRSRE